MDRRTNVQSMNPANSRRADVSIEHHQLDLIMKGKDGRLYQPWVTSRIEPRTRKIVGWDLQVEAPK